MCVRERYFRPCVGYFGNFGSSLCKPQANGAFLCVVFFLYFGVHGKVRIRYESKGIEHFPMVLRSLRSALGFTELTHSHNHTHTHLTTVVNARTDCQIGFSTRCGQSSSLVCADNTTHKRTRTHFAFATEYSEWPIWSAIFAAVRRTHTHTLARRHTTARRLIAVTRRPFVRLPSLARLLCVPRSRSLCVRSSPQLAHV